MKATLVIMAAGLGSRYGGSKQVDGLGPHREILMEYSIHDALRAGFNKVVFIIKPDMEDQMRSLCGDYLERKTAQDGSPVEVVYAFQDFSSLPDFYTLPQGRVQPYGTVHALLCAANVVHEPFCVINADDYYGIGPYRMIYDELSRLPAEGAAAMVGYQLKNTASLYGTVTRGICTVEGDRVRSVRETRRIKLFRDGTLRDLEEDRLLDPESVVSMNFWGFMPSIFPVLEEYFQRFLQGPEGQERRSECLLPIMVDDLLREGKLEVSLLRSDDKWFGMTYRDDRETVVSELRKLHRAGVYPETLRE